MTEQGLLSKYIKITLVISAYWVTSIVTVFVNKALLSSALEAPLFITWFQCVMSYTICACLSGLSTVFPDTISFPNESPYTISSIRKVLPLSVLFVLMIATNNLCLKYVGVAFYYIGRSLTTVFNVVFTYLLLGQKTSRGCIICCLVVVIGFWLGVDQESLAGSLSIKGTIYGILGSLSISLYSIYTKQVLPRINHKIWLLSYFNNAYSIFLMIPLMIMNDEFRIIKEYEKFGDIIFWLLMMAGGVCGFALGFVSALQIQVTSPITHNISGTSKACAQTVLATYWYDETKQTLWWVSNFVVLGASACYARLKQLEMDREHRQKVSDEKLLPR